MTYREAMRQAAREYLADCLRQTGNNVSEAARIAGVHRSEFYKKLTRYGVQRQTRKYGGNQTWQSLQ